MKRVFVQKGETVSHNCLYTDRLIVKGTLRVSGKVVAKEIIGGGVIEAREIICDNLHAYSVTADFITATRIAANKLFVRFECRATEQIAVIDYIEASYVTTGKLTMTLSDINACDADEIITLRQRRRGLLGFLWASWWRSLFLELFLSGQKKRKQQKAAKEEPVASPSNPTLTERPDSETAELLMDILSGLKENGYRISRISSDGSKEAAA